MKTQHSNLQKLVATSLLVMHLVVALAFTYILPRVSHPDADKSSVTHKAIAIQNNAADAVANFFHRGMRSIIEHKQKVFIPAIVASILFLAFIFGNLALSASAFKGYTYNRSPQTPACIYLSLGALRI